MKKFLICLVVPFLFGSCTDDPKITPPWEGRWSLVEVTGGFAGVEDAYPNGIIVWEFDTNHNRMYVENTNTSDALEDFLPTGEYDFDVATNEENPELCALKAIVNNQDFGCLVQTGNTLYLSQAYADGYELRFERPVPQN
jgi:hypothetical protein